MKTRDFYFELPPELIAQHPPRRGRARLLVYSRRTGTVHHDHVRNLPRHVRPDSLVVVNNSSVRRARVYGRGSRATKVEFLFIQPLDEQFRALAQGQPSSYWRVMVNKARERSYVLPGELKAELLPLDGTERVLELDRPIGEAYFDAHGHVPLPPYIRRPDTSRDATRYQTIFASKPGSVAAPTAGLHISDSLLKRLEGRGIQCCELTLHVGLGTFLPVRSEEVSEHKMHSEDYEIDRETARRITEHKRQGRPVLAVGTTSLRSLESAWNAQTRSILPGRRSTDLFIYPGYEFKVVDALLTNFHTPKSTLLMLVSAFVGRETVLSLYNEAIEEGYRFFSYGDASLFL